LREISDDKLGAAAKRLFPHRGIVVTRLHRCVVGHRGSKKSRADEARHFVIVRIGHSEPTPPAFNVVGQGATSQLASVIGEQTQEPVRAYVVSNDVTTAQGLERNIVEGATI